MSREFDTLDAQHKRPSIPPEHLLQAQLLQLFYSIRGEGLLIEQLDRNILFRRFVGLEMDEPTDPPGRIEKSNSAEARLGYLRHLLMENRHGLILDEQATVAEGLPRAKPRPRCWVRMGGGCAARAPDGRGRLDTADFIQQVRQVDRTPHVA